MLWCHTCIFLEMKIFSFPQKITSVGSSAFQKKLQRLDQPTLVNFFVFFKKNYNDCINSFSKSKWTGLKWKKICNPKCLDKRGTIILKFCFVFDFHTTWLSIKYRFNVVIWIIIFLVQNSYSGVSIKNIDILPNRQYIANTADSAQEQSS